MITKENIEFIKKVAVVFDDVIVERRDKIFDLYIYEFVEKRHIFTGNAEAVAKYLNGYFDLKEG